MAASLRRFGSGGDPQLLGEVRQLRRGVDQRLSFLFVAFRVRKEGLRFIMLNNYKCQDLLVQF